MGFTGRFYQTHNRKVIQNFYNLFQKIKAENTNSFLEASITPILKPDKDTTKKVGYRPISLNIDAKFSTKYLQKNSTTHYKDHSHVP